MLFHIQFLMAFFFCVTWYTLWHMKYSYYYMQLLCCDWEFPSQNVSKQLFITLIWESIRTALLLSQPLLCIWGLLDGLSVAWGDNVEEHSWWGHWILMHWKILYLMLKVGTGLCSLTLPVRIMVRDCYMNTLLHFSKRSSLQRIIPCTFGKDKEVTLFRAKIQGQ